MRARYQHSLSTLTKVILAQTPFSGSTKSNGPRFLLISFLGWTMLTISPFFLCLSGAYADFCEGISKVRASEVTRCKHLTSLRLPCVNHHGQCPAICNHPSCSPAYAMTERDRRYSDTLNQEQRNLTIPSSARLIFLNRVLFVYKVF